MPLTLELLEDRCNPNGGIPDFSGPVQFLYGDINHDNFADKAYVAQEGGSVRVVIYDGTRVVEDETHTFGLVEDTILLNTIVFDPTFRGGGRIGFVERQGAGSSLIVTPGLGGGPVVAQFDFNPVNGQIELSASYFAPFPVETRMGLIGGQGDVDGDGAMEALFINPETGYLAAYDLSTHETETMIFVGPATGFEPTGAMIQVGAVPAFWIQYGPTVDNHAPSKLFTLQGQEISF